MSGLFFGGPDASYARGNVASGSTDQTLTGMVTPPSGMKVRVLAVMLSVGSTATNVTLNSKGAGAGTACTATIQGGANAGVVLPFCPLGWCDTNNGETLTVTTGAGSTVGVQIAYTTVPA